MSITAKALINAKYAASSVQAEYTAPSSTKTIIDKFTATNSDASARTVTIHIVPSGETEGDSNAIMRATSIAAGATQDFTEIKNQILNPGDFISVVASVADKVVIRASGREVT